MSTSQSVDNVTRFSRIECNGCKQEVSKYTHIACNNEQGNFDARLCDDCVVIAAKKLMLANL